MPRITRQTTQNGALLDALMNESLQHPRDDQAQPPPRGPVEVRSPGDLIPAEWLIRDIGGAEGSANTGRQSPVASIPDNRSEVSGMTKSSSKSSKSQKLRLFLKKAEELEKIERQKEEAQMNVRALEREKEKVHKVYQILEEEGEDILDGTADNLLDPNLEWRTPQPCNDTRKVEEWLKHTEQAEPVKLMPSPILFEQNAPETNLLNPFEPPPPSPMESLTQAITAAISAGVAQKPDKSSDMTKYMARQSIGKELPVFTGEPEEWQSFFSALTKSTDLCGFSNEENIARLQKCLKGRAKEAVQSLLVASCSLDEIVSTLQKRFGRPSSIIQALVSKAKSLPVPSDENPDSLLDFAIVVKNLVSSAETLKLPQYLCNPQLLEELTLKLPPHLKMEWARVAVKIPDATISLKDFAEFMDEISTAIARISTSIPPAEERKKNTNSHNRQRQSSYTSTYERNLTCASGCNRYHDLAACPKFQRLSLTEKWKFVKEHGICFGCLQGNHRVRNCALKMQCNAVGCDKIHHRLLHDDKENSENTGAGFSGHARKLAYDEVLMRVIPVRLIGPAGAMVVNAFLDEGSSLSMIDAGLAESLGLKGKCSPLNVSWINGNNSADSNSKSVSLKITGVSASGPRNTEEGFTITDVRTVKHLYLPAQPLESYKMRRNWRHLETLPFANINSNRPLILLGQDNIDLTVPREIVEGGECEPIATLTKLGWVVHGRTSSSKIRDHVSFAAFVEKSDDEILHDMVKEQFKLDSLGIVTNSPLPKSKEDARAEVFMEKLSTKTEHCWETGLLWKTDDIVLPNSKPAALRRLFILEKQMDRDAEFASLYSAKIDEYVKKGFCHKLNEDEAATSGDHIWYLPHFGTTNPNKPGKLRLVFDCAAKSNGVSLNDALLQGPDLMTPLVDVLARFRQREVAFSGDIRDMFHMVRMRKEDLPSLRFLWRGKNRSRPPEIWTMDVMVFGAVSSPYQAQWVKNRNAEYLRSEFGDVVDAVVDNHYVDDYLDSTSTEDEATRKIIAVKEIHSRGGFEIRNWLCSSKEVLRNVAPDETAKLETLELSDEKLERVLGLYWNPATDTFHFKTRFRTVDEKIISGEKIPTKREILKLVMCLFDPLGFLSHLTIRAKIIIQDIWRLGLGWDDEIPASLHEKWSRFVLNLQDIQNVEIQRCYATNISNAENIQLHVFCDASELAFCAVAYLRVSHGRGTDTMEVVSTNIVFAKTRVAPLRPHSIPRMELQAALIGSRIVEYVRKCHNIKISKTVLWSDSKTTLCWIRAADPRRFKPFISHRIGEILEHTDASMWRYVPTKENVADDGTRDAYAADCSPSSRWFWGPGFLKLCEEHWPREEVREYDGSTEELEYKPTCGAVVKPIGGLPQVEKYSSLMKLLRVTAWCLRFGRAFLHKHGKGKPKLGDEFNHSWLTPSELEQAKLVWIKKVQQESFSEDLSRLTKGLVVDSNSRLLKLSPFLLNGIMHTKSRIVNASQIPVTATIPMVLDPKHSWTKLLLAEYHLRAGHHGQEFVLNELRQRYWILDMRTAIRTAWTRCQHCRVENAKPQFPQMAPLPEVRVTRYSRPFTNVGMDYFGPLETVCLRRKQKRWGVIFTCLSTRAIHLEISYSLSTDACIMVLERFISRRGEPEVIWSDNGTNMRGADTELKKSLKAMDAEKIANRLTGRGITWKFIPPSSPHMGGAWERLIKSVKTSLKTVLKNRTVSDEVLWTVFVEAEATVNSRPLTYVSSDHDDVEALTPNCFLLGTTSVKQQPGSFNDDDLCLRKKWRSCQVLADHFWKRWLKEYIPSLAVKSKWYMKAENLKIGDLVFIADSNLPRNNWPKGIIICTYPGSDGIVRVVDVKTANGIFKRPVVKLHRIVVDQSLE